MWWRAVDDTFLSRHDMHKGAMMLVDADAAETLYAAMPPGRKAAAGQPANTCAVAAALGARVAYLGKVADDQLGGVFRARHERASGCTSPRRR